MDDFLKFYIGSLGDMEGIKDHFLTADGVLKRKASRKMKDKFFLPVGIENLKSIKSYCRAWKRHEPQKMLPAIPEFVREVFQTVLKRELEQEDRNRNHEALNWSLETGRKMTDMAVVVLKRKV